MRRNRCGQHALKRKDPVKKATGPEPADAGNGVMLGKSARPAPDESFQLKFEEHKMSREQWEKETLNVPSAQPQPDPEFETLVSNYGELAASSSQGFAAWDRTSAEKKAIIKAYKDLQQDIVWLKEACGANHAEAHLAMLAHKEARDDAANMTAWIVAALGEMRQDYGNVAFYGTSLYSAKAPGMLRKALAGRPCPGNEQARRT